MEKPSEPKPVPSLIVYGLDQDSRPKAGTFTAGEAELARKGAAALGYIVIEVAGSELEGLAGQLPAGKVHEPSKGFIPYVRKDLFDRIAKATSTENKPATSDIAAPTPALDSAKEVKRAWPEWSALKPGDVVLVHESPDDGWWEATVIAKYDKTATLKWRDFPLQATVERPRSRIVPLLTY